MPSRKQGRRKTAHVSLGTMDVIAFVPTTDPLKARLFFETTLGLTLVSEDAFVLVFDANGVPLRVVNVASVKGYSPAPFTILGWTVRDIDAAVSDLLTRGIRFERFPGMDQDESGIWTAPSQARIAWFKDPDGNILSLTQH